MNVVTRSAGICLPLIFGGWASITSAQQQVIEEIVITAQKREQTIQEVPIAVAAYDAETLRSARVQDLRDLQILSPSLVLTSTQSETAGTTARIRGVGTTGDNVGLESSVAVFVDGVYRSRNNVALTDLGEIERIEVLRGPQGTLFGKNASAGLLQVVTKGPDTEAFGGYVEGSYGDYDYTRIAAGLTGPLAGERLAVRLDGAYTQRDGLVDDIASGEDYNDRDRYLLRGQLTSQITETLDLRLIADYSSRDEKCCAAVTLIPGATTAAIAAVGGTIVTPARPFDYVMTSNPERGYDSEVDEYGVSAELNWDLGLGVLTSITAYRDWQSDRSQDIDFTDADIIYRAPGTNSNDFETFSQELRLAGATGPIDWLVGAYYVNEDLTYRDAIRVGAVYESYINALAGAPGALSLLTGLPPGQVFTDGQGVVSDDFEQEADSWALFTHNIWNITDRLGFTVGVRYTEEDKDLTATLVGNNPACPAALQRIATGQAPPAVQPLIAFTCLPLINPLVDGSYSGKRTDDEWTGVIGLDYDLTDEWLAYVSFSTGYKAGGFNLDRGGLRINPAAGITPAVSDLEFEPETVDSYEVGAKGSWLDGRVTTNIAAFWAEFEDFQLNTFNGFNFVVENLSKVETKGVELDFQAYAGDNLSFLGGVTYTDATYDESVPNPGLAGERLTNAPEWIVTAAMNYERQVSSSLIGFLDVNYRFMSDYNTGSDLDAEKVQPSFAIWNGRLGLRSDDDRWVFEIWGNNLFDQDYRQVVIDAPLQGTGSGPSQTYSAFLGDPRTWGATLRINFGG